MVNQVDHFLWHKLNASLRYVLAHTFTNTLPLYIVNEYPKSGGTWISLMLSDVLGVPFPRNRLPMYCPSILHGHMWHQWNMNNVLVVWRDGRDVLVSQYYHWLFGTEFSGNKFVERVRSKMPFNDYDDIQSNLPEFMKFVFETKDHPRFSWADFSNKWFTEGFIHTKYEDMRLDPVNELQRVVKDLKGEDVDLEILIRIVDKYSFQNMTGRNAGIQNKGSFLRKGVVGDWKSHFTQESRYLFNEYAGDALIKLGYESDDKWVCEG